MPKRLLQGEVVSDKTDKTVTVKVERRFTHPLFKKTVRRTKNYHAHDRENRFKVGDFAVVNQVGLIHENYPAGLREIRWCNIRPLFDSRGAGITVRELTVCHVAKNTSTSTI